MTYKNKNTPFFIAVANSFLLLLFCLVGCKSRSIQSQQEKNIAIEKDSLVKVFVNKEIHDTLLIEIEKIKTIRPECDSVAQNEIDRLLTKISFLKKSGSNSSGIYFDKEKKQLVAFQNTARTQNKTTTIAHKDIQYRKEVIKVPVPYIPWGAKFLMCVGGISLFYFGIKTICYFAFNYLKR